MYTSCSTHVYHILYVVICCAVLHVSMSNRRPGVPCSLTTIEQLDIQQLNNPAIEVGGAAEKMYLK
jgi:hypothetical protein